MKHFFQILIISCFICPHMQAQKHSFQLGIGYQRTWVIDQQASPLRYQSSEKTILLGYHHLGDQLKFDATMEGAMGDFFPSGYANRKWYSTNYNSNGTYTLDSFPMRSKLYNGLFNIGFAKNVRKGFSKNGNTTFLHNTYAGASISNSIFYTDNMIREGWINSTELNATYENVHISGKHNISIKLSVPLFARNSRLPYHNTISDPESGEVKTFFKNSKFAWPGNFQQLRLTAEYSYSLSSHADIGIRYQGNFLHYAVERPVHIIQNNISVIGSFK